MSSYKPKLYRSQDGCCICKAKSSSSRFTDSKKYEEDCIRCFKLEDGRNGEICNACVLIVKRWKKLPANTTKDWAHVVDARTGPGIKNVFKQKKKEPVVSSSDTYKHKHVYRRKNKPKRSDGSLSDVSNRSENTHENEEHCLPDFIDPYYWRREVICCGVIYRGQLGEVMFDQRFYKKCSSKSHERKTSVPSTIESLVEAELISLQSESVEREHDIENEEFYADDQKHVQVIATKVNNNDGDGDDVFYDKLEKKMDSFTSVSLIASH